MYFPSLRGKKLEILALREKKDFILHNDINSEDEVELPELQLSFN